MEIFQQSQKQDRPSTSILKMSNIFYYIIFYPLAILLVIGVVIWTYLQTGYEYVKNFLHGKDNDRLR